MRNRRKLGAVIALYVVVVAVLFSAGTVSAQGDRQVELAPTENFEDTREVAVRLTGLDDFDGGTAAIYLCANADADGQPIVPTADDCFAPGEEGYTFGPIVDASFEAVYRLRLTGIGVNDARCVLPEDGATSCQMVVATTHEGDAKITGVPVDALLARLATTNGVENGRLPAGPATDSEVLGTTEVNVLADTGLSRDATLVLVIAAGGLFYLGYLFWSAASPAREVAYVPVHARD